jgi:hypothetical protein
MTTETITIRNRKFTAKSFSVGDIIDILKEMGNRNQDVIDLLFEDGIESPFFYRALEVTRDDIDKLDPEEVGELMKVVGRVNPSLYWNGESPQFSPSQAAEQLLRICFRLIPLGYHDIKTYDFEDFKFLIDELDKEQ